jgi:serine/threonine-protein kinase
LLTSVVGEGGMGLVFRGAHVDEGVRAKQGGDVAVKVMHAHLARHEDFIQRFRREADALAKLQHPNIVKIHDVVEASGTLALVMAWVPGQSLAHRIGHEYGPIPWHRAAPLFGALLEAMEHAHARGVIHRDLKPENVIVGDDGAVTLLDFGIARVLDGRGNTKTGTGLGTIDYMAPEQYANAAGVDERVDVYALGMTLYEMVAGRLPWPEDATEYQRLQQKATGTIERPTTFYQDIPAHVEAVVMASLAVDPTARPPSVQAMRAALYAPGTYAAPPVGAPVRAPVAAPPASVSASLPMVQLSGTATSAAVTFAVVLVVGLFGASLWRASKPPPSVAGPVSVPAPQVIAAPEAATVQAPPRSKEPPPRSVIPTQTVAPPPPRDPPVVVADAPSPARATLDAMPLPVWVVTYAAFPSASDADDYIRQMARQGHPGLSRLWIPDWPSLSGRDFYQVYAGPVPYADRAGARALMQKAARVASGTYAVKVDRTSVQERFYP